MFYSDLELFDNHIYLKLDRITPENIEKGYVPAYYFKIFRQIDDKEVGICDLRLGHNENIFYGGNIGYFIDKNYRGNKYASKASLLLLKLARKEKMNYILITCSPENIASIKTIKYLEGKFTGAFKVPFTHPMHIIGTIEVFQYRINL